MSMLESPLEALAFNYVSFGIFTVVNNLWTWVAVVTAAISFWRIKKTTYSVKPEHQPRNDRNTSASKPAHEISPADTCVKPPALSSSPSPTQATASPSVSNVKEVDGVTKGSKFTLCYYYEEEERESEGELTVVKEWREDNGDECKEWWERVVRVRMDDMGWYRHRDLAVVNGNVVRLWNECRRSERCCYSSCRAVCDLVVG